MSSSVRIQMRDFETLAHVGAHPWEKFPERPTRLIVNVTIEMSLAAYYDKAGGYIDYDPVRAHLRSWSKRPHTEYLERLAEDLVNFIFDKLPAERCAVSIEKPDIFDDVDRVGVHYDVAREDWAALGRKG